MDLNFWIGAVVGSGLYVFFGRMPARRLWARLRARLALNAPQPSHLSQ